MEQLIAEAKQGDTRFWNKTTEGSTVAGAVASLGIIGALIYMANRQKQGFRKKMGEVKESSAQYEMEDISQYDLDVDNATEGGGYGGTSTGENASMLPPRADDDEEAI